MRWSCSTQITSSYHNVSLLSSSWSPHRNTIAMLTSGWREWTAMMSTARNQVVDANTNRRSIMTRYRRQIPVSEDSLKYVCMFLWIVTVAVIPTPHRTNMLDARQTLISLPFSAGMKLICDVLSENLLMLCDQNVR